MGSLVLLLCPLSPPPLHRLLLFLLCGTGSLGGTRLVFAGPCEQHLVLHHSHLQATLCKSTRRSRAL